MGLFWMKKHAFTQRALISGTTKVKLLNFYINIGAGIFKLFRWCNTDLERYHKFRSKVEMHENDPVPEEKKELTKT